MNMEDLCPYNLSEEELLRYTRLWRGERFSDGRPKVPDALLERLRKVKITQAWNVLRNEGYLNQFAGGWRCTQPGGVLVGRAVTAAFGPSRPDLRETISENAREAGQQGDHIHWPINILQPGDVYVADVFGKSEQGPVMGDILATSVKLKSGNGVVHDAAIRDNEGIMAIPDFVAFYRDFHPSFAAPTILLLGLNTPIRIGLAIVLPGDVVLGKGDGVIFIPAHLAEKVAVVSEVIALRDRFAKERLGEGIYLPGQLDAKWTAIVSR